MHAKIWLKENFSKFILKIDYLKTWRILYEYFNHAITSLLKINQKKKKISNQIKSFPNKISFLKTSKNCFGKIYKLSKIYVLREVVKKIKNKNPDP